MSLTLRRRGRETQRVNRESIIKVGTWGQINEDRLLILDRDV